MTLKFGSGASFFACLDIISFAEFRILTPSGPIGRNDSAG